MSKEILDIKPAYDFNFICLSMGLLPINNGAAAIAPGAVTDLQYDPALGIWVITLHGGKTYTLSPAALADLEDTIKQRAEDGKILAREAFKANAVMQNDVISELQRGVVGAQIVGANKRRH